MAKKLDEKPFHPLIFDGDRPTDAILVEALHRIYNELRFQLASLGSGNFDRAGLASLSSALGVPRLWSGFDPGEMIPKETLVIYNSRIFRARHDMTYNADEVPTSYAADWENAS